MCGVLTLSQGQLLPQVEEFRYLRILFTSKRTGDQIISRRIGTEAAVMKPECKSETVDLLFNRCPLMTIPWID